MAEIQNIRCYSNSVMVECTHLCDRMGYSNLSVSPFLTFIITMTSIVIIYGVIFYIMRRNCTFKSATINCKNESVHTQCDMDFPLQQILIHPDNTIHFLKTDEM